MPKRSFEVANGANAVASAASLTLDSFLTKCDKAVITCRDFCDFAALSIRTNDKPNQCEFWKLLGKLGNQCIKNVIHSVQIRVTMNGLSIVSVGTGQLIQCYFDRTKCNFSWSCTKNVLVCLNKYWFLKYIDAIQLTNLQSAIYIIQCSNTYEWTLQQNTLNSKLVVPLGRSSHAPSKTHSVGPGFFQTEPCVVVDKKWLLDISRRFYLHNCGNTSASFKALADGCFAVECKSCCEWTWMADYMDSETVSHELDSFMQYLYPLIELGSLVDIIVQFLVMPQAMLTLHSCLIQIAEFAIIKDLLESISDCHTVELYFNEQYTTTGIWINPTALIVIPAAPA